MGRRTGPGGGFSKVLSAQQCRVFGGPLAALENKGTPIAGTLLAETFGAPANQRGALQRATHRNQAFTVQQENHMSKLPKTLTIAAAAAALVTAMGASFAQTTSSDTQPAPGTTNTTTTTTGTTTGTTSGTTTPGATTTTDTS